MKTIYTFQLTQEIEKDKIEVSKNEAGDEIKVTKKIKEPITRTFSIKRPNRAESDSAEIFRAATESDYIKKGILPATLLQKRYAEDNGIFSDKEKKEHEILTEKFIKLQTEYSELIKTPEKDRTDEQKKKTDEVFKELSETFGKFNELENLTSNLYNRSAEALSRNKTCLFLALILSYEEKDGKKIPVFGEGDFEAKLGVYDTMEERENDFEYGLIQKLMLVCSLWYMGRCSTKEEFDASLLMFDNNNTLK